MDQQHAEPPNPWAPVGAPPPTPPKPRTILIVGISIGLAALLVATAGVFGVKYLTSRHPQPAQAQQAEEITLTQAPGDGRPLKFGDTALYDACSVITIDQLAGLGVSLDPKNSITHEHLDGDVPPGAAVAQSSADSASYCAYVLSNGNRLSVSVHQTPFNTAEDLAFLQTGGPRRPGTPRSEDGVSLIQWNNAETNTQRIDVWKPDLLINIYIDTYHPGPYGTMDVQTFAIALEPLVKSAVSKGPTAPMRHVYSGLLGKVKNPCEAMSRTAFRKSFPAHSGEAAMTEATFYPAAPSRGPEWEGQISCERHNIVPNGNLNEAEYRELHVSLSVRENEQIATEHNTLLCGLVSRPDIVDVVTVTPSVGTGRTCMLRLGSDWTLQFQVGHVGVSIRGPLAEKPTQEERRELLVPAAQAIAEAGLIR
ncbi:hypothetical protein [Lentzea sp. NPDC092896]|uniref:hypothetical protein n=1 Tax=Lentzea sp. NPDC092896 TaxID=3364127 RepID=UPI00381D12C6